MTPQSKYHFLSRRWLCERLSLGFIIIRSHAQVHSFLKNNEKPSTRRRWKFLVPADWPAGQLSLPTLKTELPFAPYKTMMHFRSNTKDVCLLHKWGKQRKITTNYPPHRHHGFMTHPKGKTNTFLARWCFSQIEPEKSKNTVTQYYEFTSMRISNPFDKLKYVTTHWLKH